MASSNHVYSPSNKLPIFHTLSRTDSNFTYTRQKRAKSNKHDTLLKWKSAPKNVLIVKKINNTSCTYDLLDVSIYLLKEKKINIYFQQETYDEIQQLSTSSWSENAQSNLNLKIKQMANQIMDKQFINSLHVQKKAEIGNNIHFIIVLGGDGTLLYLVSLFTDHRHVPPIVCFQRGSLGFLAPFQIKDYKEILSKILDENETSAIAVRMRLTARIWRHPDNMNKGQKSPQSNVNDKLHHHRSWSKEIIDNSMSPSTPDKIDASMIDKFKQRMANSTPTFKKSASVDDALNFDAVQIAENKRRKSKEMDEEKEKDVMKDSFEIAENTDVIFTKTQNIFPDHRCNDIICHALNEVLVHRDNSASMMQAKLFIDGDECTVIQADGMIFSTPTGSTAYNVSAGGSLITPTVPCIALTPICPHTLSFRPVIVSDETIIHVQIPKTARFDAIISFDGRNHIDLYKGDVVEIVKCPYSVPTFKSKRFNVEWFQGLVSKFNWNLRELQKPFETEEDLLEDKNDQ